MKKTPVCYSTKIFDTKIFEKNDEIFGKNDEIFGKNREIFGPK